MLVLCRIRRISIGVEAIRISSIKASIDDRKAHWTSPIFSYHALKPAVLCMDPVHTCTRLCHDAPRMLAAANLEMWPTLIPHFDVLVHTGGKGWGALLEESN